MPTRRALDKIEMQMFWDLSYSALRGYVRKPMPRSGFSRCQPIRNARGYATTMVRKSKKPCHQLISTPNSAIIDCRPSHVQPRTKAMARNAIKSTRSQSKLRAIGSERLNFRIEIFLQRNRALTRLETSCRRNTRQSVTQITPRAST